jgi:hypothetical protein
MEQNNTHKKAPIINAVVGWISLIIGITSLACTIYQSMALTSRIAELETQSRENLFRLTSQINNSTIPANNHTILTGEYTKAIPENFKAFAVVEIGGDFYIQRNAVSLLPNNRWSLDIKPTHKTDDFKVIICLTNKNIYTDIQSWQNERKPNGEINYDNPRRELNEGIYKNSIFVFKVK